MNLESYYIKANHDWKWTDSCNEKYSNPYEFISNVSEEYHIKVTGENDSFGCLFLLCKVIICFIIVITTIIN